EYRLRDAAAKKILLEVTLLKAMEARNAVSLDSVLKQLQNLRDYAGGEIVSIPIPVPAQTPAPVPVPTLFRPPADPASPLAADTPAVGAPLEPQENVVSSPPPAPAGALVELWDRLVEAVGRVSQFTRTYLLEAHPVSFKNNVFTIGFDPQFEDHIGL